MSKSKSINKEVTDLMREVIDGMQEHIAELYLASFLGMAWLIVQLGDIMIDIVGDKKFKVTAQAKSGVRNLMVNLVSSSLMRVAEVDYDVQHVCNIR